MAVKVINVNPKRPLKVDCQECGAELEYMPIDVKEYHGHDYTGGADGYKWIDCPNCSKKVILESW
jgi:DNA-directed RNA polymerase subunit RPC12/RpoP